MGGYRTRRGFLTAVGAAALAGCAEGTSGGSPSRSGRSPPTADSSETTPNAATEPPTNEPTDTQTPHEWDINPIEHDKRIGAYYYTRWGPWLTEGNDRNRWTELSPATPVMGAFDSRDPDVANQHIKWAREHGINWLNASWGGSHEGGNHNIQEEALQQGFMEAELKDRIDFSIFYESDNPLEWDDSGINMDNPQNRERLHLDFGYMEDEYFYEPNYLTLDGRPVVTIHNANEFSGSVESVFNEVFDSLSSDPYLLGDFWGGRHWRGTLPEVEHDWITVFDAETGWDLEQEKIVREVEGEYSAYVDWAQKELKEWALAAKEADLDHIPNLYPGKDLTQLPRGEEVKKRKPPLRRDPAGFREMAEIVYDHMDPDLDTILITTLNGWPEYTAVAPAQSYGETYLDIIEEELAQDEQPDYFQPDGHPKLRLKFDRLIPGPKNPVEFGMRMDGLDLLAPDGETLHAYDIGVREEEPYFLKGMDWPSHSPEPGAPYDHWRWLGISMDEVVIAIHPEYSTATQGVIHGQAPPFAEDTVGVDIYVNGTQTDHISLHPDPDTYTISLR